MSKPDITPHEDSISWKGRGKAHPDHALIAGPDDALRVAHELAVEYRRIAQAALDRCASQTDTINRQNAMIARLTAERDEARYRG